MRSWLHIALLIVGLVSSQLAGAQTLSTDAVKQSERQLGEIDRAMADLQQQQARLLEEARALKAQIEKTTTASNSALVNSERGRLMRRAAVVEQRRRGLVTRLDELEQRARDEASALLVHYQSLLARDRNDLRAKERQGQLQQRLQGASGMVRGPASVREQLEEVTRAEAALRHKARLVATKIRQLRNQQRLAGDVMRTVREQALFDEEERKLSVSRVVPSLAGSPTAAAQQNNGTPAGAGGQTPPAPSENPGGGSNTADPGAFDDSSNGSYAGLDGDSRATGGAECATGACGTPSGKADGTGGISMSYSVVSGNRLNSLLDQNVETLLGNGGSLGDLAGSPEELKRLEALRIELLRNADELARKRNKLEIDARSTPR